MVQSSGREQYDYDSRQRRQRLRLPHSAAQALREGHEALDALCRPCAWALPPTGLAQEVAHYSKRHGELGRRGPVPTYRTSGVELDALELAVKIDAALHFLELSHGADPFVEPILLYYSCAHLCGVYTRAYLEWQHDSLTHGLSCRKAASPSDVGSTKVTVKSAGQFPRLATTCFLMSGAPSCFCELVTYSSRPTAQTGPGELLENFSKTEVGQPPGPLTLDHLTNFDYAKELRQVRVRHGFHKFRGLATTAFLVDVMSLFLAGWLARYDVLGWQEVLEGKSNSYYLHFQNTFGRFRSFTADRILRCLEDPSISLDTSITAYEPSPYSHDDRRFGRMDPNYA